MAKLRRSPSRRAGAGRTTVARTAQQRTSSVRRGSAPIVVGASGAPLGAIEAMQEAYLLVLRGTHAELVGQVQDAAPGTAAAQARIRRAVGMIKNSVDEDLHKIPGVQQSKLAGTPELVRSFEQRNVNLIKTVADDHREKVRAALEATKDLHADARKKALQETLEISESKAKFWAEDQTLKLHADIVETQHKRLGIEEYEWRTSQDGTVRDDHAKLNGKRFRYDSPPVTNVSEVAKGRPARRCNPGKDYRCRCHADPVLPGEEQAQRPQPQTPTIVPARPKTSPQAQSIKQLPPDVLQAVRQFTEFESPAIRAAQTAGIETPQTRAIAKAFELGPDAPERALFRGLSGLSDQQLQERLARDVVHFSGRTTSTSASLTQALRYTTGEVTGGYEGNAIIYEFRRLSGGSKALSVAEISKFPKEREVLIQGDVRWRVVKRVRIKELPNSTPQERHYLWRVVLEELPPEPSK